MRRGKFRVYLGAAPGVGKTFAMLDEGWRRRDRGTDVVIGLVVTHGRVKTIAQIRDLEVIPPRREEYRDCAWEELDVDAILARRPEVVLVDAPSRRLAAGVLRQAGYRVEVATSAKEAFSVLRRRRLGAVVLDPESAVPGLRRRTRPGHARAQRRSHHRRVFPGGTGHGRGAQRWG